MAFNLKLKLWLEKDGKTVFGYGRWELLKLVEELGSLHKAAEKLGISYRSAWAKIRDAEKRLGFDLLARKIGGKSGGGSVLTSKAKEILSEYKKIEDEILKIAKERFERSKLGDILKT